MKEDYIAPRNIFMCAIQKSALGLIYSAHLCEWLFWANTLGRTTIHQLKWAWSGSHEFSNKEKITVDGAAASTSMCMLIIQQTSISTTALGTFFSASSFVRPVPLRASSAPSESATAYNYCYYDADAELKREIISPLERGAWERFSLRKLGRCSRREQMRRWSGRKPLRSNEIIASSV